MKWWLYLILFTLITLQGVNSQVLLDNRDSYSFNGNVFIFNETSKALSVQEAWNYYQQNKFNLVATPDDRINMHLVKHFYWLAIPIKNVSANIQNLEVGIDNGGIFHLEFYLTDVSGKLVNHYTTGTNYDFYSRPILNRHFYFPLNLQPQADAIIFYRIDMRGNGLHIPLRLIRKEYNQLAEMRLSIFYSFFSGALLFVSLFSFLAYLWTKDRLYIFYAMNVISYCLFFLGDGNFDVAWIYPHWTGLATISPSIYGLCLCFFMLLFMSDFLYLKTSHKKLFYLSRFWGLLLISAMLLLAWAYVFSENITLRIIVFIYCLVLVIGVWGIQIYSIVSRIIDKYQPAYLYGAALIFIFLASGIYVLHVLNIVPYLLPAFIYIPLGFTVEIIMLSFALIYSYNFHKRKHQQLSVTLAEEQLNFSKQLIQLQETEQKRIAENLHDELGGNLAAIKMNLQSLQLLDESIRMNMIQLIDKASDNARDIAHNLMPPEFSTTKLNDLLQTFFNQLNGQASIHFHYHSSGENNHFDKGDDLMIYRIIMELTHNIIKHSVATEATLQLIYYDAYLEIMAEDNGKGFSGDSSNGIGLTNIKSRVNYLHGTLNIDSSVHGTTIMIKVPYKK